MVVDDVPGGKFVHSTMYTNFNPWTDPSKMPLCAKNLERILRENKMKKPSCDAYVKFTATFDFLKAQAFSQKNIRLGWRLYRGLPKNEDAIFEQCTDWPTYTDEMKQRVRDSIAPLTVSMQAGHGIIDERLMRELLGDEIMGPRPSSSAAGPETSDSDDDDESSDDDSGERKTRSEAAASAAVTKKAKKELRKRPLHHQRTAVMTAPGFRYLVHHRGLHKQFKAIYDDLKVAIKALPKETLQRAASAAAAASSSSAAATAAASATAGSSSSSSSSSAAAAAAGQPTPASAPAASSTAAAPPGGKVKKHLKKCCENTNCAQTVPTGLTRCEHCYMTFCGECSSVTTLAVHHASIVCKKLSFR